MHRCSATSWKTDLVAVSFFSPSSIPPSLTRRARRPSCPVLLVQWDHCGWGAGGGCAGAEMQKSSTARTLTGPALPSSSCITCCKPEQPKDCSKSHSSRGNERAESRDRRGGEGSWQALCYFPAPQHSSALLRLEASTADLPTSTPHPFPASQGVMLCHLCIKTYNPLSDRGL